MFQDKYRRDMEAVGPSEEQLARLMAAIEKEEKPVKTVKLTFKTVLIAACLCVAFVVTALAVSPGLREALSELLSGFEPYVQEIDGTTAVANGIEIEVVSAMSDPYSGLIYYKVKDLTGNRVDNKTIIDLEVLPEEGKERWKTFSFSAGRSLYYDEESKIALMASQFEWPQNPEENRRFQIEFSDLVTGIEWVKSPFPEDVELTDAILASETMENGRVVLMPNQTARKLGTDYYALSSFGFGSDDRLHFLYEIYDERFNPDESLIRCGLRSKEDRAVLDSGRTTDSPRERRYNNGAPEPVLFQRNGKLYYDICKNARTEDFEDIFWSQEIEGWFCTGVAIEGPWVLEVSLVNAPSRKIRGDEQPLFNGEILKSLSLTSLGIELTTTMDVAKSNLLYPVALFLSDGSIMKDMGMHGRHIQGNYYIDNWTFNTPVEPNDVIGISIGQWYIPIEEDTVQSGHWLPELP